MAPFSLTFCPFFTFFSLCNSFAYLVPYSVMLLSYFLFFFAMLLFCYFGIHIYGGHKQTSRTIDMLYDQSFCHLAKWIGCLSRVAGDGARAGVERGLGADGNEL